jgi:hypothetical protein
MLLTSKLQNFFRGSIQKKDLIMGFVDTLENKIFWLTILCLIVWVIGIYLHWEPANTQFIGQAFLLSFGALAGVYSKGKGA